MRYMEAIDRRKIYCWTRGLKIQGTKIAVGVLKVNYSVSHLPREFSQFVYVVERISSSSTGLKSHISNTHLLTENFATSKLLGECVIWSGKTYITIMHNQHHYFILGNAKNKKKSLNFLHLNISGHNVPGDNPVKNNNCSLHETTCSQPKM